MSIELFQTKDNLIELANLNDNSIDHFITDIPFNSNRNYVGNSDDEGVAQVLKDQWEGGVDTYIEALSKRLEHMTRCLKHGGNIIMHCDDTAGWQIETMLRKAKLVFRDRIMWGYAGGGISKSSLPHKHDFLFVFTNTTDRKYWKYTPIHRQFSAGTKKHPYHSTNSGGKLIDINKGTPISCIWSAREEDLARQVAEIEGFGFCKDPDFGSISPVGSQTIGKAVTEKPLALYQQVVYIYTDEGDSICDPYMGGGTTIMAAESLNRNSIGMDCDVTAYKRTVSRCKEAGYDYKENKDQSFVNVNSDVLDRHQWAARMIELYGGIPNPVKSGDKGIDGYNTDPSRLFQCKKTQFTGPNLREFIGSAELYIKKHGMKDVELVCVARGKDNSVGFTRASFADRAQFRLNNKDNYIKDIIFTTDQQIEDANAESKELILNLMGPKENKIRVDVTGPHKRIVRYSWCVKYEANQSSLFFQPDPVVIQTTVPELDLSSIKNVKQFNHLRCEIITSDGGKKVREMRLH